FITAAADVLQIGAAAEQAFDAAQDNNANGVVTRHLQSCFAQIARRLDVERIESLSPVDGDEPDRTFDGCTDVGHWHTPIAAKFSTVRMSNGPQASRIIHSRCAYEYARTMS